MPPSRPAGASAPSAAGSPSAENSSSKPWPSSASKPTLQRSSGSSTVARTPGECERLPAGVRGDRERAAGARRDRLAAGEQQRQRAALARAIGRAREAEPCEAVELRRGVAERERDAVAWPHRVPPRRRPPSRAEPGLGFGVDGACPRGRRRAGRRRATCRTPAVIVTVMRRIAWRRNTRRITARVGGSRNSSPKMSVRKPGVSSSAPPKITSTPSATSRAGARRPAARR